MIKVCIVDDKRIMRLGIAEKLQRHNELSLLFVAENGRLFLEEMKGRTPNEQPDVVLMDIDMPELDGIETVRMAKEIYPQIEFVMLTVFDEDEKIFEAIKAGATGYLLKDENTAHLIDAIVQVHQFKSVPFSPVIARKALSLFAHVASAIHSNDQSLKNPLSDRETEVLKGLVDGLDYKSIAEKMFVSPHTVRNHMTNIYNKLHVTCKVDAVKLAIKNQWT